jgi:hypothetical protein
MNEAIEMQFMIDNAAAFFSGVWPHVAATHPMMIELAEYAPEANRKQARYRGAVLRVAAAMTKPTKATSIPPVMCHVRSFWRPDDHPSRTANPPETR